MIKKNILRLLLVFCITLNLTGCQRNNQDEISEIALMKNKMDIIVKCFDEKDSETLKTLFSPQLNSVSDIDSKIETAFSLYNGKSQSYDYNRLSMAGGGTDNGVWIDKHFRPVIDNIKTDEGKTYSISFCEYTVYSEDETKVGIIYINLVDENGDLLARIM